MRLATESHLYPDVHGDSTPDDATFLPEDGERDYTVDTGDAESVIVALDVCDNVTVTEGDVSFGETDTVDGDTVVDFDADAELDATISDVEVDGVAQTGTAAGDEITVNGGEGQRSARSRAGRGGPGAQRGELIPMPWPNP